MIDRKVIGFIFGNSKFVKHIGQRTQKEKANEEGS